MQKLIIIKESKPIRCDICHKNDYFNQEKNYCSRCNNLIKSEIKNLHNNFILYEQEEQINVDSVKIEDFTESYTIIYQWLSISNWKQLIVTIGAIIGNLFGAIAILFSNQPYKLPFYWLNILNILFVGFFFIFLLMILFNKTYIKIMNDQIEIDKKPIGFQSKKIIFINQIKDIILHEKINICTIYLLLENGKKVQLITNMDKNSIKFVEKILKAKIFKRK